MKYKIWFHTRLSGEIEVEADNEDEAIDLAYESDVFDKYTNIETDFTIVDEEV